MSDAVAQLLAKAHELEQANDANAALATFDDAIANGLSDVLVHSQRGLLLERLERIEDALQAFRNAAEAEPNFRDHYNAGNMLLRLQRNEEAVEAYEASLTFREDYPECWVNLGIARHALGHVHEARAALEKALAVDAAFYPALRSLAILCSSTQQLETAIEYYRKAAEAQPQLASAWFEYACALYKTLGEGQVFFEPNGPEGLTVQALDKAIELSPDMKGAWGRKIGVLFRLADAAEATDNAAQGSMPRMLPLMRNDLIDTIETACQRFPDDPWFADRKRDAEEYGED